MFNVSKNFIILMFFGLAQTLNYSVDPEKSFVGKSKAIPLFDGNFNAGFFGRGEPYPSAATAVFVLENELVSAEAFEQSMLQRTAFMLESNSAVFVRPKSNDVALFHFHRVALGIGLLFELNFDGEAAIVGGGWETNVHFVVERELHHDPVEDVDCKLRSNLQKGSCFTAHIL